ncbi:MAG TPA: DUF853 family protein, partial [Flavobacteriales bacterium]|nr:DUF853 family protein [Flavobacteriales bacterium]
SPLEIDGLVARSQLVRIYNEEIDRESAFEILEKRMQGKEDEQLEPKPRQPAPKTEPGTLEKMTKNPMARRVGNTIVRELTRGLLGVLGIRSTTRRRRY